MSVDTALLRSLPKCEHHIHIEGALTPHVLFDLAAKHNIALPTDDPAFQSPETLLDRYKQFESLDDFLHYYRIGTQVLVDQDDWFALTWDYFQHAAADGVMHAELFFEPQYPLERGISYETLFAGFRAAQQRVESEFGITSQLIACYLRHRPSADILHHIQQPDVQASYRANQVAGIGLGSSERPFPPELFNEVYDVAGQLGLRRTAHAGEEGPAAYVRSALDNLHVTRVDHGIHAADDPTLLERLAKENVMLTVCPLSNLTLRCVSSVEEVPIRKLLDAGVPFSINSDDPAYFGGHYILDNYCAVQDAFNLSVDEWARICRAGIAGSWCSEARKVEMGKRLEEALRSVEIA